MCYCTQFILFKCNVLISKPESNRSRNLSPFCLHKFKETIAGLKNEIVTLIQIRNSIVLV